MFNKEIKLEYMDTVSNSISYILNNLLNKASIYEYLKGKDVCNWIEPEIIDFMVGLNSSSINTLAGYASMLRGYTQWCCDNNINADHINHFDNITIDMLSDCVNHVVNEEKFISLDDLHRIMDNIVNPCDKALVFALWSGICGKECTEIINLTTDMIDYETNKVKLNTGKEFEISNELKNLIYTSCDTYDYILTTGKKFDTLPLDESDKTLFKRRSNARYTSEEKAKLRIVARLLKLREDTGCISLTINRLQNSGVLWHMKKIIAETNITKETIYNTSEMKALQKRYGIEHQKSFQLRAKYKMYL